jgi:hypothetical protein
MAVEFLQCAASHVPALQTFFRRVYREDYPLGSSTALFEWQFGERNGRPGYCCKLALVDGQIAGCLGYIPTDVTVRSRVVRGAWTANWIVDPAQRRLGIGPLLMRELTRDVDVTLVVGLSHDSRAILPRMGWTDFGELDRYVRVLDQRSAGPLAPSGFIEWPEGRARAAVVIDAGTSVRRVDRFGEPASGLWDAEWGCRGAGARRSAEFLNWRYADHPTFEYRLFEARRGPDLAGFAVYRVEQVRDVPVRVGRLVELFAAPASATALIDALVSDALARRVSAVDFFCSRRDLRTPLLECGFLPGDHPLAAQIPILFQPVDRRRCGIPFMAHLSNVADGAQGLEWYVTKGDGDQDRPN